MNFYSKSEGNFSSLPGSAEAISQSAITAFVSHPIASANCKTD